MGFQILFAKALEPMPPPRLDIDHDRFLVSRLGRQAGHDAGEHSYAAPALPPVAEGLGQAVFAGRITLGQAILID